MNQIEFVDRLGTPVPNLFLEYSPEWDQEFINEHIMDYLVEGNGLIYRDQLTNKRTKKITAIVESIVCSCGRTQITTYLCLKCNGWICQDCEQIHICEEN